MTDILQKTLGLVTGQRDNELAQPTIEKRYNENICQMG